MMSDKNPSSNKSGQIRTMGGADLSHRTVCTVLTIIIQKTVGRCVDGATETLADILQFRGMKRSVHLNDKKVTLVRAVSAMVGPVFCFCLSPHFLCKDPLTSFSLLPSLPRSAQVEVCQILNFRTREPQAK